MKINSVSNVQNFSGARKIISITSNKDIITTFVSKKGSCIGRYLITKTGDVSGHRVFANGAKIAYATSHGSLYKTPFVTYECYLPENGVKTSAKLLVFDLDKFKANMKELTSLAGIKRYFAKIEKAPKTTKFEPCC